jgi:hypothetical protein
MHLQRLRARGTTEPRPRLSLAERFWEKVEKTDGCWLWTGSRSGSGGYGQIDEYGGGQRSRHFAHRLSLVLSGAQLEPEQVVRHDCDVPACVNPAHLRIGTQRDNVHDAIERGRADLTGLQAPTPKTCRTCGAEFMGVPSRRYCAEHQPSLKTRNRR